MIEALTNINVIFYCIAYLCGGIPFGYLLTKYLYNINIMEVGSGAIGATNVYRALKDKTQNAKKISILTIILDSIKGLVVILIAKIFGVSYETQWAIAILSVLGHCYSPYLKFSGGKGVATAIGSVILLIPIEGILGLVAWGVVGKIFKISSISSLVGVSFAVAMTFVIPPLHESISIEPQIGTHAPVLILLALIIYTHLPNIYRLITKQEKNIF